MLIMVMLLVNIHVPTALAVESEVTVRLPAFHVTINGISIENEMSGYPLIVYRNITYMPLTYYDCRFLGLESIWRNKTGLTVEKTGANWKYHKYQADKPNDNTYTAKIADFKIRVNGKNIDNSKEKYPVLFFRNIAYFPLTWRFAVEEFGWKYSFDKNKGLVINSTENENSAGQLVLPIITRENGEKGAFTMAGDYFYYEGAGGCIYKSSVESPLERKKVYQLPREGYGTTYVYAKLKTENGKAMLSYYSGGVAAGTDRLILLNENGTFKELNRGYSVMKVYDDCQVRVNQSLPPVKNNLQIKRAGASAYKNVGNPEYLYGWIWKYNEKRQCQSGVPSEDLYLINDNIYVLGNPSKEDRNSLTGIYKIDINTEKTERVCKEAVSEFKVVGNIIYFTDLEGCLYKVPIDGGKTEKLTERAVSHYNVLNEKIYYSLKDSKDQLYIHGNDVSVNPGGNLKSLEVQNGYMVAVFNKDSESPYKMMIIDDRGKVIYKTMERVLLVRIENGKVVFVKDN